MNHSFYEVLKQFYEVNKQGLFTYALSLTRDASAAEDAVQSAIFGILKRTRLPRNLRPYVFRAVRNAAIDIKRKNTIQEGIFIEENGNSCSPFNTRMLNQCLEQLPDEQRDIIVMKAVIGLTFSEISHLQKESINTVTSRYRRAIDKMRSLIGDSHD
jgi:RNA polymerase sigma-70 factor (ECF subfamily)